MKNFFTPGEAGRLLGAVSGATIAKEAREGRIPHLAIGSQIKIHREYVVGQLRAAGLADDLIAASLDALDNQEQAASSMSRQS